MHPKHVLDEPVDLSRFDETYSRAEPHRPGQAEDPDELPDGIYEARVEDVSLRRTATTGNPMVLWKLRITGPTNAGAAVTKVRVITEKTLSFLREDLERLGLALGRLSELQSRLDDMIDQEVTIFKKRNVERRWTEVSFMRNRPAEADIDVSRKPARPEGRLFPNLKTGTDDDLPF